MTRRFRIVGKVQGVNFRHSTRREAERLGVCGFARNLEDGSVEVLAHGAHSAVEQLRAWLGVGPRTARVETVSELEAGTPAQRATEEHGATTQISVFEVY